MQNWLFLVVEFFLIINHLSGKALQASISTIGEIVIWTIHGYDNQLWFWDQQEEDVLRNKMFPNKVVKDKAYIVTALCIPLFQVVDIHWNGSNLIYLNEFHNDSLNQKWLLIENEIVSKGVQSRIRVNISSLNIEPLNL